MASEFQHAKGYLYRLLADGALPFRYRGSVRSLLGLPELSGVEVNFSKRLPFGGFSYVVPRFSGEFEFPDEFLGSSPRRTSQTEAVFPGSRAASEPTAPVRRTSEAEAHAPGRTALPGISQGGELVSKLDSEPKRKIEANIDSPSKHVSKAMTASEPSQPARGRQAAAPSQAHEIDIPGGISIPNALKGVDDRTHAAIHSDLPGRVAKSSYPIQSVPDAVRPNLNPQITGESQVLRRDVTGPQLTSPKQPASVVPEGNSFPGIAPRQARLSTPSKPFGKLPSGETPDVTGTRRSGSMAVPDRAQSPLPRTRSAQPYTGEETTEAARSLPSLRRPDAQSGSKAAHSFEDFRQAPEGAAPIQAPTAPSAPSPIVVVQSAPSHDTASPAFWERRHLGHIKVRIRR